MRICLVGDSGRMGKEITAYLLNFPQNNLIGGINHSTNQNEAEQYLAACDVAIDFSLPASTIKYIKIAAAKQIAYVIGTTGFTEEEEQILKQIAQKIAIVKSGNMSLGLNILLNLVAQASAILAKTYNFDIDICEIHHKHKRDKPSGTAKLLGEAIKKTSPDSVFNYHSLRAGGVIGDHEVIFSGDHERIVLSHIAHNRQTFAAGAVNAALWAQKQPPGLYNMQDVLNLNY